MPLSVKAKIEGQIAPTFDGRLCKYVKERAVAVSLRGAPCVFVHWPKPQTPTRVVVPELTPAAGVAAAGTAFGAAFDDSLDESGFCERFERFSITASAAITAMAALAVRAAASCCWQEMTAGNLASDGVLEEGADGVVGRGAADEVRPYTMHNSTR